VALAATTGGRSSSAGRRRGGWATAMVLCLLAAGCGSRLDLPASQRQTAARAALGYGNGGSSLGASGSSVPGAGGTGSLTQPGSSTGSGSSSGPVAQGAGSGTGGAVSGTTSGGAGSGTTGTPASLPPGGNGGATDVGVTATSITVGNVSDLSGPVPGLFQGAVNGTESYFAYLNSQGGIDGRQVKLQAADGQTDCTANQNAHSSEIGSVFAFVGSFSLYDDCGTKVVAAHPDVPDVSFALGEKTQANTVNQFSPQFLPAGGATGPFCYFAQKYPDKVKAVGSIYANIPSAAASQKAIQKAAEQCGWTFIDSIPAGATDTTFNAQINRMRSDGVKLVFEVATTVGSMAEMKKEADAQNWKPLWVAPVAYTSTFFDLMGSTAAAEGVVGYNLYSLFLGQDDAKRFSEVALFQQWMKRVHPEASLDLFAMYGWGAAKLFAEQAKAAGPKLTRKAFLASIRNVHSYDAGKMFATSDIGGHQPPHCYILWQAHAGSFQRLDSPGGYRCDGRFVRG
jgi:ABC-type branched-subunit amino acid transport system substrate-binding protein